MRSRNIEGNIETYSDVRNWNMLLMTCWDIGIILEKEESKKVWVKWFDTSVRNGGQVGEHTCNLPDSLFQYTKATKS